MDGAILQVESHDTATLPSLHQQIQSKILNEILAVVTKGLEREGGGGKGEREEVRCEGRGKRERVRGRGKEREGEGGCEGVRGRGGEGEGIHRPVHRECGGGSVQYDQPHSNNDAPALPCRSLDFDPRRPSDIFCHHPYD